VLEVESSEDVLEVASSEDVLVVVSSEGKWVEAPWLEVLLVHLVTFRRVQVVLKCIVVHFLFHHQNQEKVLYSASFVI